jgi:RES domain-containing protein
VDLSDAVAALDGLPTTPFEGEAYRHVSAGREPLSGEGARLVGGRWNPPGSFAVLYLGLDERTVIGEFERLVRKQGRSVDDFLPRDFYTYELRLQHVLDLRAASNARALGLTPADFVDDDLTRCQLVGESVHAAGFEALVAPSAAGSGEILAVFLGRMLPGSLVRDVHHRKWTVPPPERALG